MGRAKEKFLAEFASVAYSPEEQAIAIGIADFVEEALEERAMKLSGGTRLEKKLAAADEMAKRLQDWGRFECAGPVGIALDAYEALRDGK